MRLLRRLDNLISINVMIILMAYISQISNQPIWTAHPHIRTGQVSIFDTVFLPLDTVKTQDILYSSPLVAPQINKASAVIAGFMNYLSTQMYINVTINDASSLTKMGISIYMGANTYVKILDISYFAVDASPTETYIEYSFGNYVTLGLQARLNETKYGQIILADESFSVNPGKIIPGISAFQLQNPTGLVNNLQVKSSTSISSDTLKLILSHKVSVTQENNLTAISIKTLKFLDSLYFTQLTLANTTVTNIMAYQFNTEITNISGFTTFDMISPSNYFNIQNQIYFGLTGFQFQAVDSRIFQLLPATNISFRNNLQTNTLMNFVDISVFLIAVVNCPTGFFYKEKFTCVTGCTTAPLNLLQQSPKLCVNCDNTCNGCTGTIDNCNACYTISQFRVQASTPGICTCDTTNGYVEAGNDVCQKCSVTIPGCSTCSNLTNCINCYSAFEPSLSSTGTVCKCPSGKYYAPPGYCLDKPGCLKGNNFIGVQFCEQCDNSSHFILNITTNNTCDCMQGYLYNTTSFKCEHQCGNGITPSGIDACDDGDTDSGDGCSSNCTVEYGYTCTVKVTGGISTCVQKQQISITFLYAQKNLLSNQATLVFSLVPAQPFLSQQTFQNSIQTDIPSKSSTIVFDAATSLIYMTVEYNQPLEANSYSVNFTFAGMSILSNDLYLNPNLKGINAKLDITTDPQQITIVFYVSLGVGAFALFISIVVAIIGQKLMGIQLIMPIQAAFLAMATFPQQILAPLSALWPLKFSCGYNILKAYQLSSNYMLDPRISTMQFSGQYILNYNITFSILFLIIIILLVILARLHYLQAEQTRLQGIIKKNQDDEMQRKKNMHDLAKNQEQITPVTKKQDQNADEDLQDVRENLKNWKNMMYMLLDRFFTILILTSLMIIVFCFYLQFSNLTYSSQVMDNSLNASFFFLTYATLIIGLYTIVYDYKSQRLIVFNCNKGKYYIFYILIYFGYVSVLGAVFQTSIGVYAIVLFGLMPLILIPYQKPYGINQLFDFQNIVAFICQLPFLTAVVVSLLLNLQVIPIDESLSFMLAYSILGVCVLSIVMTLIRMVKIIDFKKITFIEFSDRKKNNGNDKNKKKQKVALLQLGIDKDWDQISQDSVRGILFQKEKLRNNQDFNLEIKNKQGYISLAKKNQFTKPEDIEDQDQDLDQIDKIKLKLRRQLKNKKNLGLIK